MSDSRYTLHDFIRNFPFLNIRDRQHNVLHETAVALASGYKFILLEAPTGFGKSPVAVAIALTLGSSYICTATKDLQAQYSRDFPYIKVAKGKNNFICTVKEDFIKNDTYKCGSCVSNYAKEDWAKTYVLDTAFGYFVRKNRNTLPDWFVQAIRSDPIYSRHP